MRTQHNNDGNNKYIAALYLRVSQDDGNNDESASISTQRKILRRYIQDNNFTFGDEYVDDGVTGTNYDRPAFKRMMNDIDEGKINCVITKDLSRLGRNSARTTDLIDIEFPKRGVRYIAVTEGYDSLNPTSGVAAVIPLMSVVHEMYARDTSNKIRMAFNAKIENGEYIGNFAPYGYKKDSDNKNHLVVDYQVSHIVQEMFTLAADGVSPSEIAKLFNSRGIPTPAQYRCINNAHLNIDNYSKRKEWTSSMVCKMLKNRVYLGHTLQGKTHKISFKSKETKAIPREEWTTVENTHEPLITENVYRMVRDRSMARRNPPNKGFTNVFSGIAVCADCGRAMTPSPSRKKGKVYNLCCGGYKAHGTDECKNHFIDYELLYNAVSQELHNWLSLSNDDRAEIIQTLTEDIVDTKKAHSDKVLSTLSELEKRERKITQDLRRLYEDMQTGKVSTLVYEQLMSAYENDLTILKDSKKRLEGTANKQSTKEDTYKQFFSLLDEVTQFDTLTKPLLYKLIDRIEVEQGEYIKDEHGKRHKHQRIRIYYRFIGCVDEKCS